jgi:hypothetical protein
MTFFLGTHVTAVIVLMTAPLERGFLTVGIFAGDAAFFADLAVDLLFPDFLFILDADFFTGMLVPHVSKKTLIKYHFCGILRGFSVFFRVFLKRASCPLPQLQLKMAASLLIKMRGYVRACFSLRLKHA